MLTSPRLRPLASASGRCCLAPCNENSSGLGKLLVTTSKKAYRKFQDSRTTASRTCQHNNH